MLVTWVPKKGAHHDDDGHTQASVCWAVCFPPPAVTRLKRDRFHLSVAAAPAPHLFHLSAAAALKREEFVLEILTILISCGPAVNGTALLLELQP